MLLVDDIFLLDFFPRVSPPPLSKEEGKSPKFTWRKNERKTFRNSFYDIGTLSRSGAASLSPPSEGGRTHSLTAHHQEEVEDDDGWVIIA